MQFRRLGRTELKTSVIGVGTWQYGGEWDHVYSQAEVDAILDRAAELGINLVDTAECYGDHLSESLIGDYLSRRDRSRWIVATKFGHQYHKFMDRTWLCSPEDVRTQMEASLRALRVDAIDLYQFHSGSDEAFRQPELWAMLEREKQAGKIRHLGVSIMGAGSVFQAREARAAGAEALQIIYNRLDQRAVTDYFPHAQRDDLGVLARVPLASGFLTGKYKAADRFAPGDVRSTFDPVKTTDMLNEVARIQKTEAPPGVPMAQWALAWCLKNPTVHCVIPGCKNPGQVETNAAAVGLL